jgi:hypothetical protein
MNGNGNGKRNGRARQPTKQRNGSAARRLQESARSDLHEAGLDLFSFFETMINPEDYPPHRVPDSHAATSAVFKTPFVVDLPFSGVWDPSTGSSDEIDEKAEPTDGYSEVILVPGSTDCYFHTLGVDAEVWPASSLHIFEILMVPVLATHPVDTDIVNGNTQLFQGLRSINTAVANVAILPKADSVGHAVMECLMIPTAQAQGEGVEVLIGFHNVAIKAPTRTRATLSLRFSDTTIRVITLAISSTGDNNTLHSDFYVFQTTLPSNLAVITAFWVEVDDVDPASQWKYSFTSPEDQGFGLSLQGFSACAFRVVDAPEMGELSETLSERTTALTGLITYMGSTLQDGGQVAAARLGMGLSPLRSPHGDTYTYLASLPFYNDDFALRDGAYCWWLPDSIQEHFYCPYRNPRSDDLEENAVLQFALLRDNPNQSVRLKVVQNLEVITRSRLYTSVSGPNNPAYGTIVSAVKSVPAVTINTSHLGFLGKALSAVKSWVSKPQNWRKLLTGGAGVIQKLAPGSAPASIANSIVRRFV